MAFCQEIGMRYLFTVAVLWAVATSPAWATQYLCRSTKVLGLIYQTNVPCPGAILIDQTGPYGGWLKTPKEQREARASANQVEAAVKPGMTADNVRQLLGAPAKINTSVDTRGNRREQWVYRGGKFLQDHYVNFDNGAVVSAQTSR